MQRVSELDKKRRSGYRSLAGRGLPPPKHPCLKCSSCVSCFSKGECKRHECGVFDHRVNAQYGTCPNHSDVVGRHFISGRKITGKKVLPSTEQEELMHRESCRNMIEYLDRFTNLPDHLRPTDAERVYAYGKAA